MWDLDITVFKDFSTDLNVWPAHFIGNVTVHQIVKNFPTFYGIVLHITAPTELAVSSNSEPHDWEECIYLTSILTLSLAVGVFKWHQ